MAIWRIAAAAAVSCRKAFTIKNLNAIQGASIGITCTKHMHLVRLHKSRANQFFTKKMFAVIEYLMPIENKFRSLPSANK